MVSIAAFQAVDLGSIPGRRIYFCIKSITSRLIHISIIYLLSEQIGVRYQLYFESWGTKTIRSCLGPLEYIFCTFSLHSVTLSLKQKQLCIKGIVVSLLQGLV